MYKCVFYTVLSGDTALHDACSHGQLPVAELLLHAGADAQLKNNKGKLAADMLDVDDENTPKMKKLLNGKKLI